MSAASSKVFAEPLTSEQWARAEHAQAALARMLKKIFGRGLQGVNAFGADVDRQTKELSLQVTVDDVRSVEEAARLPPTIEGLPVKVGLGTAGWAD